MLSVVYGKKMIQAATWKELSSIPKDLVIRFFKTSSPVIFNEVMWASGIFLYSWVFAQISAEAMVIITIVQNIERLLLVFFHGSGNAGGVLIGKAVGAGHFEDAYLYTKRLIGLLSITSVILSVVFIFARPLILMPYDISPEVYAQCMDLLVVIIIMMTIKSLTFLLIVGAFRNGGDTKTAMKIDVCCVWLVGLPMVLLGAFVLKLPLLICYAMMCTEEVVKIVVCMRHFSTRKWIKNVVSS
jgi:Na+-driven multidrug efflux pump